MRNTSALAAAYSNLEKMAVRISKYGIRPDLSEDEFNAISKKMAEDKAELLGEADPDAWKKYDRGQGMYLKNIQRKMQLDAETALDEEYKEQYALYASPEELEESVKTLWNFGSASSAA